MPPRADTAPDRLDTCNTTGWIAVALVLAVLLAVGTHLGAHQRWVSPAGAALARAIGTLSPALMPAGSMFRAPALQQRAVDLRHSPGVPAATIDPAALLVCPKPGKGFP